MSINAKKPAIKSWLVDCKSENTRTKASTMQRLISNGELKKLTEKYHILDGEMPLLIKLLWDIRHFQEDLMELPIDKLHPLIRWAWELDQAIALQILEFHELN